MLRGCKSYDEVSIQPHNHACPDHDYCREFLSQVENSETLENTQMPKSRRAKLVSLTQTERKGKEGKEALFRNVRSAVDAHRYTWIFAVENMRNTHLKEVRARWSDSRILLGRSKVIAKAIGMSQAEAYCDGMDVLAQMLKGTAGLLCTNHKPASVIDWFADYSPKDFARAGTMSTIRYELPQGPVYSTGGMIAPEDDIHLSHTMEPLLRGFGG